MRRSRIYALSFLIPFLATLFWFSLGRVFASFEGTPFEALGSAWIVLQSLFYGTIGLSFGLAIWQRTPIRFAALLLGIGLIGARGLRRDGTSYLSLASDRIGYYISLASPRIPHDDPLPQGPQPAIPPLTQITARTAVGELRITSGRGLLRTYSWDGVSRSLELIPPDPGPYGQTMFHTRVFAGGERVPWHDWKDHDGITRGEAWESRKDFPTQSEAEAWLAKKQDVTIPLVWTSDGVVVGWSTAVDWRSLTVETYQVLIAGQKPDHLAGSDDSKVTVQRYQPTVAVAGPSHADFHGHAVVSMDTGAVTIILSEPQTRRRS